MEIQSDFYQALDAFLDTMDGPEAKQFLESKKEVIVETYRQSELNNLRLLRQVLFEFERLWNVLDDKYKKSDQATVLLLRLLSALGYELKAGRIKEQDIFARRFSIVTSHMPSERGKEKTPLAAAQSRYRQVDLGSTTLSDETLADILTRGIVDRDKINRDLDASSFFVDVAREPDWRTVWYALERTDEQFESAFASMEQDFIARNFTVTGEILHVFGLRLWLTEIGAISRNRAEVVRECESYVDDLLAREQLEPHFGQVAFGYVFPSGGHGGLIMQGAQSPEFLKLYSHLSEKQHEAAKRSFPKVASELLQNLARDPGLFSRRIAYTVDGENRYYRVPVLASLDPDAVVRALTDLHPSNLRVVMHALKARYDDGRIDNELVDERPWAEKLRQCIVAAAKDLPPITRYRFQLFLKNTLDEVLPPGEAAARIDGPTEK